ncbi:MAG: CDP-2,3-bis-(O-geranylgeranyl)-sn-glycerol synthase [Methanomicrobiales archaeon]|nr:CDP-2,3-bis-(O-geranylgeranyl)-sn-glycerol synthase [Methanomicrobiales archaeon]
MQKPNLIGMLNSSSLVTSLAVLIGSAIWVMLPAYLPNNIAALTGGGTPIDLGKKWSDGRRILGDGKTIRGFILGVSAGIIVGLFQIFAECSGFVPWVNPHTLLSVMLLAIGSLLGDMIKSFFKRRKGIERGGEWKFIDQYDFVAGALILAFIFDMNWFFQTMTIQLFITILVITPVLHRTVNIIGYKLGLKKVPW